jgi:hypothetical protein
MAPLVLNLGPRAGVLSGLVIDRSTGNALSSKWAVHFILTDLSDPDRTIEIAGPPKYRILIPPDMRVVLDVKADGYKPWSYLNPLNPSEHLPVRLEPGQEMPLDISLEPASAEPITK